MAKQLVTALAAAVLLVGGSTSGCAVGAPAKLAYAETGDTEPVDFTFTAFRSQQRINEVGRPGPSIGDGYVEFGLVMQDDERLGTHGDDCTVVEVAKDGPRYTCLSVVRLPGGQLTLEGLVQLSTGGRADYRMAVTGGTGDYAGVTGSVHVTGKDSPGAGRLFEVDLL